MNIKLGQITKVLGLLPIMVCYLAHIVGMCYLLACPPMSPWE